MRWTSPQCCKSEIVYPTMAPREKKRLKSRGKGVVVLLTICSFCPCSLLIMRGVPSLLFYVSPVTFKPLSLWFYPTPSILVFLSGLLPTSLLLYGRLQGPLKVSDSLLMLRLIAILNNRVTSLSSLTEKPREKCTKQWQGIVAKIWSLTTQLSIKIVLGTKFQ